AGVNLNPAVVPGYFHPHIQWAIPTYVRVARPIRRAIRRTRNPYDRQFPQGRRAGAVRQAAEGERRQAGDGRLRGRGRGDARQDGAAARAAPRARGGAGRRGRGRSRREEDEGSPQAQGHAGRLDQGARSGRPQQLRPVTEARIEPGEMRDCAGAVRPRISLRSIRATPTTTPTDSTSSLTTAKTQPDRM